MNLKHPECLLTGPPRVGKTTLIREAVRRMPPDRTGGFVTAEIKKRPDIRVLTVTPANRKELLNEILA
jgi:nucleoside-triphosphatase THEP1